MSETNGEKAPQSKVVGVIIPPPEIRAVVDKTAQFVAKNGKSFEQRILSSGEGKTAKFNFMKEFDPYHAYYEMRIREMEEAIAAGKDLSTLTSAAKAPSTAAAPAPVAAKPAEAAKAQAKTVVASSAKAALANPVAKLAAIPPKIPPYTLEFTIAHPSGVSAAEIDIIKLAAQYTAVNGREFLSNLAQREQRNPQFDFLKPTHMLFSYFTALVDAYVKILHPSEELQERVRERATSRQRVFEYAVHRWNWQHSEEQRKRESEEALNNERIASSAIDWNDFAVVEVIDFGENELLDLPGLASLDISQKEGEGEAEKEQKSSSMPPPPPPLPPVPPAASTAGRVSGMPPPPPPPPAHAQATPMAIDEDDEDDEKIKVVSNYQPRIASAQSSSAKTMTIDPVTGKAIPLTQIEEHMRIQLLDPKWKEEQRRFQEKQKETGFAEGASIADSLKIFAQKRGDIFGQTVSAGADSAAAIAEQEAKEKQKNQETAAVQWDGHLGSMLTAQQLKASMPHTVTESPLSSAPAIGPSLTAPTLSVPPPPSMYAVPPPPPLSMPPPMPVSAYPTTAYAPVAPTMPTGFSLYPIASSSTTPAPASSSLYPFISSGTSAPPPPAPVPVGAPSEDDQKSKKPRLEENLIPADEFAALHPSPIQLTITIPQDASAANWNFNGQTFSVEIAVSASVKDLKELIAAQHLAGMPANKLQLKSTVHGFLKDTSLAALNIGPSTVLDVSVKSRGGKK